MAANTNMHNLTTLIKRLEAATLRLEGIASSADPTAVAPTTAGAAAAAAEDNASTTPVQHEAASESQATLTPAPPAPEPLPRVVEDFDTIIEKDVGAFVAASARLGGLVEKQARAVQQAFEAERKFLLVTTKAKKPDQLDELIGELHRYTSEVDELKVTNRSSSFFPHLRVVSEGVVALGWITGDRPADFVASMLEASQYYGNGVVKEHREKDKSHVEFVQAYYKVLRSLIEYVKENFKMGLVWNNKDGIDAVEALKQIESGTTTSTTATSSSKALDDGATGGAPPPPPPPPPPPMPAAGGPPPSSDGAAKGGDMTAVFGQINQGSNVTSGLRRVDKSEMTHKNPSLRTGGTIPQRSSSRTSQTSSGRGKSPLPARKPENLKAKKPSKKELDGNKWIIENFENTGSEVIEVNAELNHSILISRCNKCVVKVNGKANAISIDNSSSFSIMVGSLVSSIDVIKSPKFAVQVDGVLPTIMLDQVDGGLIYLSEGSIGAPPEIFTSKCSSINVVTPPQGNQDSKERPLPEQLRTFFKDGRMFTEIVEHAG